LQNKTNKQELLVDLYSQNKNRASSSNMQINNNRSPDPVTHVRWDWQRILGKNGNDK
jgi:hypothetical protein